MKTFATLSAALLMSSIALTPAMARDWKYVTTSASGVSVAVSPASFVRAGDTVSGVFRFRDRSNDQQNYVSIDCARSAIADTPVSGPAGFAVPQTIAWRPVTFGSLGAHMLTTLCPGNGYRENSIGSVGPVTTMPPPVQWAGTGSRN